MTSEAQAHAFTADQGHYALFVEGVALVVHTPDLCVAILSVGLWIGIWRLDGMPRIWPSLMVGAAAGLALASFVGNTGAAGTYAISLGFGFFAIVDRPIAVGAMRIATALAGAAIASRALSLHGVEGLSPMIPLGLFAGLNVAVAMTAGIASLPQRHIAQTWPRIGMRVLASWLLAVTILMLAFDLS